MVEGEGLPHALGDHERQFRCLIDLAKRAALEADAREELDAFRICHTPRRDIGLEIFGIGLRAVQTLADAPLELGIRWPAFVRPNRV